MNRRLAQLGEKWRINTPAPPPTQTKAPVQEKATLGFGWWSDTLGMRSDTLPTEEQVSPDSNGVLTVHFLVRNTSSVGAERVEIWVQICQRCSYASEPQGFDRPPGEDDQTRHKLVGDINPGVSVSDNTLMIKVPTDTLFIGVAFAGTCKNCDPPTKTPDYRVWLSPMFTPPRP